MTIGVPPLVIDREAPDYAQHMTTDVNDAFSRLNIGVSDQFDEVNSDISALTATVAALSAGWKKISTATASNSATIDFTTGIDSTYNYYVFVLTNVRPVTDAVNLWLRVSLDGGASWKSDASYRWFYTNASDAPATAALGLAGDVKVQLTSLLSTVAATRVTQGIVELFSPSTADFTTHLYRMANYNGSNYQSQYGGFVYTASAINGVRFLMSSGNISAGTFTLYGVPK